MRIMLLTTITFRSRTQYSMAAIPSLEEVYSWVPAENQLKLDLPIDFRDLSQIADHLLEWDGSVAVELQLGKIDVHDIIVEHRSEPRQQR